MALIKCSECGKEISDKAKTCIYCGCPIEKETSKEIKESKEKDLLSIEVDIEKVKKFKNVCLTAGIVVLIIDLLLICSLSHTPEVIPLFLTVLFFTAGPCFLLSYIYKKFEDNQLVLTNKRLKGCISMLFVTTEINIPLEKIDNLVISRGSAVTNIQIMSHNMIKTVNFVLNADEFVNATLKEIEKCKNK